MGPSMKDVAPARLEKGPAPSVDVQQSVSEPAEFYRIYKALFGPRLCAMAILTLGSCAFELVFPFLVGFLMYSVN